MGTELRVSSENEEISAVLEFGMVSKQDENFAIERCNLHWQDAVWRLSCLLTGTIMEINTSFTATV